MMGNPKSELRSTFEDEVKSYLEPLEFENLGSSSSFVRKTTGPMLHLVEVQWDVDSSAGVRVAAWHPILHNSGATPVTSLSTFRKESVGDRVGEGYVGSNLFFRCDTRELVRESCRLVRKCLAEGAIPFVSAIHHAKDVIVAGVVSAPRVIEVSRGIELLKRGMRTARDPVVLPRLPQRGPLPKAGRYEIVSSERWLARAQGGAFLKEMTNAGFEALKSELPELSASLTFQRRRRHFTDMVHLTFGNYGARSEVQCLTWIPEFNGLTARFDLSSNTSEFVPELSTAWWLGEGGLSDRQALFNFMDLETVREAGSKLVASFKEADEWMKRKSSLTDLFEFPEGAIEAAEALGARGYREHLEEWRRAIMVQAAGAYETH